MERYSYSKLELFDQCPYRYKLKYIDGNYSNESTLPLELGSLTHKGRELWGEYLIQNKTPDFQYIDYVIKNGFEEHDITIINGVEVKNEIVEDLLGLDDIKKKYFEDYIEKCNKTGMNYDQKMKLYWNTLLNEDLDEWKVLAVENDFEFIYENRCILHGFIDRIDINNDGDIRVIDYKTSKAVYDDKKLVTPLQMVIYGLACEVIYKKLPKEYWYDFIFLGKQKQGCTKGYLERGKKKLNSLLDKIDQCKGKEEYIPKPSPLCYYCSFSNNTCAKDNKFNGLCEYYSLWTPVSKNYNVNKKWNDFNNLINNNQTKKEFVW